MIIRKEVQGAIFQKGLLDIFIPRTSTSSNWKHWKAVLDLKTCESCRSSHGTIYAMNEMPSSVPPLHFACRCAIEPMRSVNAGQGSREGENGADWWLKYHGCLPNYYISEQELRLLGWKWGKSPEKYAPGRMPTMGVYRNADGHLPSALGRVWHEADLNYYSGKRNAHRILWSNDGLIFVTYDHYRTFIELV